MSSDSVVESNGADSTEFLVLSKTESKEHAGLVPCHRCENAVKKTLAVRCQNHPCQLFFCHLCLTRNYKYSRGALKKLPGPSWSCPKCKERCNCTK